MNVDALKKQLEKKERDLQAYMALHEAEGRGDARAEVNERGIDSEDSEEQFQQATLDRKVVVEVREALNRIEHGTYGKCIDCGRRIEPARLLAIPWTPYCLDDQNRHDRISESEPTL